MPLALSDKILIGLLAERDCIVAPVRDYSPAAQRLHANSYLERDAYRASGYGIPWASGEASRGERQRSQLALEELAGLGAVEPLKEGGRTARIRLLPDGESYAQEACRMPVLVDDWPWLIYDAILRRGGYSVMEDHLIPVLRKSVGLGDDWDRRACLGLLMDGMTPFLARDWVFAASTMTRNVRYLPGDVAAVRPDPAIGFPDIGDVDRDAARSLYLKRYDACYSAMMKNEPSNAKEIGMVPLCASAVGQDELAAWTRSAELASAGL